MADDTTGGAADWAAAWLDGITGASMSQRRLSSVKRLGGGLDAVRKRAEARGVHLLLLEDDERNSLRGEPPPVHRSLLAVRSVLLVAIVVLLAGCIPSAGPLTPAAAEPVFRPEVFFAGPSHGDPILKIRTKAPQQLHVQSRGTPQADGTFRLDQTITRPDGHADERTWIMQALGGGRYSATLTPDASGSVEAYAEGNRFHIHYRMGRFTTMDQTLSLHPGGQVADNVATVRALGIPIARLTETIARGAE